MRRAGRWVVVALALWVVLAYLAVPAFWRHYEHLPAMSAMPTLTRTPAGLPGDPLNVALVGSEEDVLRAFAAAAWRPADPITLASSLRIAASVVLHRPDPQAPVSTLLLFGRKQDLAFEQDVGGSAEERHHVRFWRTDVHGDGGAPVWVGAATFDRGVGLSHTTGQITHHIGADLDAERDALMEDLEAAGWLRTRFSVTGIGPTLHGRNGGGDRYYTDGEITVGVLAPPVAGRRTRVLPDPTPIVIKQQFWSWIRPALAG
ncbi:MAG TPA: LssY C-terminal domain-containing protein [Candidatus Limnocylindria bacterium]|nr:LssY C-terminal domain-containing protein [Candidatus Limnocylindria bacterium]